MTAEPQEPRQEWADDGRCCEGYRCNDCPGYDAPVAPVAQEPPARWVKPAMRPPTDAEVAECTECDSDGCHPEVDMRKPVGGKCWFGCEKPINPPPDPMWCADPAPGSAQEQADPPWLTAAAEVGELAAAACPVYATRYGLVIAAVRAALPILRAGIEQELREKLAGEVASMLDGQSARIADAVRGQS